MEIDANKMESIVIERTTDFIRKRSSKLCKVYKLSRYVNTVDTKVTLERDWSRITEVRNFHNVCFNSQSDKKE